jgi:hypothetical protein
MVTNATGCYFSGNPSPNIDEPVAGSVVDTPNGGLVNIQSSTFYLPAGAQNTIFFGYAMENTGASNNAAVAAGATNVKLQKCVFDGTGAGVAGVICNGTTVPGAILDVTGSTYVGPTAPKITGFASVIGTLTQSTTAAALTASDATKGTSAP